MHDRPALLARLMTVAATLPASGSLSWRLCEAARQVVVADGVSVAVVGDGHDRLLVASTGTVSADLEELHADLGEGPAVSAAQLDELVTADLTQDEPRWARFAESATRRTGATLVVAVPMRTGTGVAGTLMLHRMDGAVLTASPAELAELADLLTVALLHDSRAVEQAALEGSGARATLNQAVGMVMAQLSLTAADALAVVRAHAFALDRSVSEVAIALVDRRFSFSPDDPP